MPKHDVTHERRTLLARLYAAELASEPSPHRPRDDAYLRQHAQPNSIARHVAVFERYWPFLPAGGDVLDWGCNHAPDACLIRHVLGDDVSLCGCDFPLSGQFPAFHEFARLDYRTLMRPSEIPFADASFDAVVGSGVLEHTPNDSDALRELHRVIRDDGVLVITFLPNHLSWTEFVSRRRGTSHAHSRLYGLRAARRLMLHHGFEPVAWGYHQLLPAHQAQQLLGQLWFLNAPLERTWPLRSLASNLFLVSRRRREMR